MKTILAVPGLSLWERPTRAARRVRVRGARGRKGEALKKVVANTETLTLPSPRGRGFIHTLLLHRNRDVVGRFERSVTRDSPENINTRNFEAGFRGGCNGLAIFC